MTEHMTDQKNEAGRKSQQLDHQAVINAYRRYGRLYNLVFGAIMEPGRRQAIKLMNCQTGDHVLELGVGTGLALPYYPREIKITGIDLSPEMLRQAQQTITRHGMENVELIQMDAQALEFPDHSFNKIAVMYVASVVPDPKAMLAELRRVCQPNGDIFVMNHFASQKKFVRGCEKIIAPLANLVGFHSDFEMPEFIEDSQMELLSITSVNAFGYWKLLHFRNCPPPSQTT